MELNLNVSQTAAVSSLEAIRVTPTQEMANPILTTLSSQPLMSDVIAGVNTNFN